MELREIIVSIMHEYLNEQENKNDSMFFSKIGLSTEDVFDMIRYADNYRDLYPGYNDEENEYEEDYYFSSKEEAYEDVNNILDFFNSMEEPITIYRTIAVGSEDAVDKESLGESWSYIKDSAISFAEREGLGNHLLIAKTNFNNIDWRKTLELYFIFTHKMEFGESEDELFLINHNINSGDIFDLEIIKIKKRS